MGLQGSLKDFKITEIIQLIGQQFKTGVLHVQSGRKTVEVFFLDGLIVHVLADYRSRKDLLGEILLKAKKISQEDLDKTLRIQGETLQYTGEIMVELKLLTEEEIVRVISTQVYETVYDLMSWKQGSFRFDLRSVESYKKISIALSPEHVLLNVLRMMDEWPEIEARISSFYVVFKKANPLPKDEEEISPAQRLAYELADGELTLQEIIDRSLLGKSNTCEAMVELWDQGYVERVGTWKPSFARIIGVRVGFPSTVGIPALLSYAMILAAMVVLFLFLKPGVFPEVGLREINLSFPQSFLRKVALERIEKGRTVYYLENGEYPDSLQALVNLGLITPEDLLVHKEAASHTERGEKGGHRFRP